ncbi:MAG: sulfite exporter TauE/SafE family protein [Dictyoglomus sp.]|nr:sulfite exporter TauE/SafE family protein [Dictyoglomus sp.]MDW8188303.1 sulfite exporter TauE/SafE family protein [Dictyoglomus sp.]
MEKNIPLELFITGLSLSFSYCSISCTPPLLFYIAGNVKGLKKGLRIILIFSLFRLLSYILLGFLSGLMGVFILNILQMEIFHSLLILGMGIFTIITGIFMIWRKEPSFNLYKILFNHIIKRNILPPALLGFFLGIAFPCAPLLSILTYIAFNVESPWEGAFYGFFFGLGSSFMVPLFLLGTALSVLPPFIFKNPRIFELFRKACGFLIILLGLRFIFSLLQR